nr:glycosyltransferase family 9 protein [Saprospiraceae bacterium]
MKILVIRFSAMGDVTMASPVIKTLLRDHSSVEVHLLSRPFFEPLFEKGDRFRFIGADLKSRHKGVMGLRRLYRELRPNQYDVVVDLHDSLRSKVLRTFFRLAGVPVSKIDKGRKEKKRLLKYGALKSKPLIHSTERYARVFQKAGMKWKSEDWALPEWGVATDRVKTLLAEKENRTWVGIAPFAAHPSKEWPFDKMRELAMKLRLKGYIILWFGAGKRELEVINQKWLSEEDILLVDQFKLEEELYIMKQIEVMVCMDSANMHMAAVGGTRVVSIWGPTHPHVGFGPLGNEEGMVQIDLSCRPCSIYGKLKSKSDQHCARKSMELIQVKYVVDKIDQLLSSPN